MYVGLRIYGGSFYQTMYKGTDGDGQTPSILASTSSAVAGREVHVALEYRVRNPEYQRVDDAYTAGLQSPRVIEGVTMWSARKTLGLVRNALSVPEDQVRHAEGDLLPRMCKALARIAMCPCHVVPGAPPTTLP